VSSNDPNNPKPLPDDFGMTMQNISPSKRQQSPPVDDFDMTTPNIRVPQSSQPKAAAPPPAPDDFGMTMQNAPRPSQSNAPNYNAPPPPPADDYGATTPNLRLPNNYTPPPAPSDDFDLTMQNRRSSHPGELNFDSTMPGAKSASAKDETDFGGATMPYISLPQRERARFEPQPETVPATAAQPEKKRGFPLWAWLIVGGSALMVFLAIGGVAAYLFFWSNTGFNLVIKGAQPRSDVFIDGMRVGVTSADGSTKIFGLKADDGKRNIKVTREGYTDFNDTILGENGSTKEVVAQMKPTGAVAQPTESPTVTGDCKDDPRVCKAEDEALDALDRLKVPFTVDELVAALNLHIINFDSNKSDIPPAREKFLRKAAEKFKLLTGNPIVEIGGHTDNVGNDAANLILSQDRGKAVRTMYVAFGVKPTVLTTRGYGKSKTKADNATEEGRFKNRRIEYAVVSR